MRDENKVMVKTRKDFDELNAMSLEDIVIMNRMFGYEFLIENGKIVGFTLDKID